MKTKKRLAAITAEHETRRMAGKAVRDRMPRSAHANWRLPDSPRRSAVELLHISNHGRLDDLVPMRHARMLKSPLAFFRGLALAMARDFAALPSTGMELQLCGDCHLQNFGWFATPERNLIFDITDFDETYAGPWEWDLKRLAVSVGLAARGIGTSKSKQQSMVRAVVETYRDHLRRYELLSPLQLWYERLDAQGLLQHATDVRSHQRYQGIIDRAHQRTVDAMMPTLAQQTDGAWQIIDQPPLVFHPPQPDRYVRDVQQMMVSYRETLSAERRALFDRYRFADAAYKVVGVGSVGLRCGIALLMAAGNQPLVLQVKEARRSVLQSDRGTPTSEHQGERIVAGQRLMQAASDMFLGWTQDHEGREYYVRQLRDMKMSVNTEALPVDELEAYGRLCGWALARAHAKVGDPSAILGYIGSGELFDVAIVTFADTYASQVEKDFDAFVAQVKLGAIPV